MQEVSNEWKDLHKRAMLNESFVEISLDISDPEALASAKADDNGASYISTSSQITNGGKSSPIPYCTLEQNIWCLDGNRRAVPKSNYGDNCYISDVLSDDTCLFNGKKPIISLNLGKIFDKIVPGITITWSKTYGEFADTFSVIVYSGSNIRAEKEVALNRSVTTIVMMDISNYDRIDIVVKKWCLPNHRARVEEVFIGVNKVYGKSDLFSYSHNHSVDPLSMSLPKNEIKFSIDNVNGEYNPYNKQGLARYLINRQEIKVRYGLRLDDKSVEWVKGGTFYLSEWYAKQNGITADFTARDALEFMSAVRDAETSLPSKPRSLYYLAETLLNEVGVSVTWNISNDLESIYTNAPLPEDTYANLLQLIANAGKCVLYQDRDGVLNIKTADWVATDYEIDSFNSYSKPEITLSKPIRDIKIKFYEYNDDLSSTTYEYIYEVDDSEGETITFDNPLITSETYAMNFGGWLNDYYSRRISLDFYWRPDVRLDPLDMVTSSNEYITNDVYMTDIKFTYNGAFRGTGKGKVI